MKRIPVLMVALLITLSAIPVGMETFQIESDIEWQGEVNPDSSTLASASSSGMEHTSLAYMTRSFQSQSVQVLNSYSSPTSHTGDLDFTKYLISGWDLYNVTMEVASITAIVERESTGVSASTHIDIANASGDIDDVLYQAFYDQGHDGKLENYSLDYQTPFYSSTLGDAYLVIRSDYKDAQTNETDWLTPFIQVGEVWTTVTDDCSSQDAILNANQDYYAVIDGSALSGSYIGVWWWNTIYWRAAHTLGVETGRHYRNDPALQYWYIYQGGSEYNREADFRYTYTPWNTTLDSALTYADPTGVGLTGNLTALNGMTWTFTDSSNVTAVEFSSNQSVEIAYNVTLNYKKDVSTSTFWNATSSGQDIDWNATTAVDYPSSSESKFLNITVPSSWSVDGLYSATLPSTNHGNYEDLNGIIRCSSLGNDTWTLTFTSRNYLSGISIFDNSDDTEIISKSRIDIDIAINSTLTELDSDPVSTGTTNLTIQYQGETKWAPTNESVSAGTTHYLWDVSAASTHGLYRIEQYWTNGTEAGYRTKEIVLYYPTTLIAAQSQINGFTESTVDISVDFDDTYTPQGLDGTFANVVYSFDGGVNTSLVHQSGGTWTASVPTTGKSPGSYALVVYADGYALENQSTTIDVHLIHDTEALTVVWSNTNNISYVESTEISVAYNRVGGSPISTATVNVTIGGTSFSLIWDSGSDTYKRIFYGDDVDPGFGTHSLTIQAWSDGYKAQSDASETLIIHEESTTINIEWSASNSITYVESVILYVDYEMSNTTAIPEATVEVTIDSVTWPLHWNDTGKRYWLQFNGSDTFPGFGIHSLTIEGNKYGYEYQSNVLQTLTITKEPTTLVLTWSDGNSISYVQTTILRANYTQSNGLPVTGATVNVSIGGGFWSMIWNPANFVYELSINGSDAIPGFGTHLVTVLVGDTGFEGQSDTSQNLIVSLESTSIVVSWSNNNSITFIEQTTLIVSYRMSNNTAIPDATVNVTIDGNPWDLIWDGGTETYRVEFSGSDILPGFGTHGLTIRIGRYGYVNHVNSTETLTVSVEPTSMYMAWLDSSTITYLESTTLVVNYRMSDTSPISGATVTATIDSIPYLLTWHPGSQTYRYTFNGSDNLPGIGIHSLTIDANRTGFVSQSDPSEFLIINEEPTSIVIAWSNTNNITFIESTVLSVNYTMSNGSAVTDAIVNVTIGGVQWDLIWDGVTETYLVEFFGYDEPPGFGTHSITIRADKFGYESRTDASQSLILASEPTSLVVSWIPDNDITYATYSTLVVSYRMDDLTPISGAIVNATFGGTLFPLTWSPGDQDYRLRINGSDVPPGFGIYSMNIQASKKGFDSQVDLTETVTLREEPTSLVIQWSNGNDLGFYEHTYLFVDYRMANLSTILRATLNVTINGRLWTMIWNATEGKYQVRFEGSDTFPGVGTHSITIRAGNPGFIGQVDSSQTLTLPVIPTTLSLVWTNSNSISYVEQTTLRAIYQMYNTTPVTGATLNVTIDSIPWVLVWNITAQAYEYTFLGSYNPPGLGTHSVTVLAWKEDFQSQSNSLESLIVSIELTSLDITWTNGNNVSYHSNTTLSVAYLISNLAPIDSATLNATIGGTLWILTWNPLSKAYETTIFGSDIPPGYGTHSVVIEASRFGFEPQIDSTEELTLRVEDTSLVFQWAYSSTISFVEETTFKIFYTMSNGSPVVGAIVNVTIGPLQWDAVFNVTSGAYEILFKGEDEQPGLGTHILIVRASKPNYQEYLDISQALSIIEEEASISTSWTDGNDISYSESTTLYVHYTMSNGTDIPSALVEVTIGTHSWALTWDGVLELYKITFIESGTWPGLGTHGLSISGYTLGYATAYDTSETLTIRGEFGEIVSYWIGDGTITYVESDTLVVNYTIADGTAISGATVNVTIDGTPWDLFWHAASETYRITFNGTDNPPGMGSHSLTVSADRLGYDDCSDTTKTLNIIDESTTITVVWSDSNSITYFESTYIFVTYSMGNGSAILGAVLNVTIDGTRWNLLWNSTQGAYGVQFSGSDNPPGFGIHTIEIQASKFGFEYISDTSETLTLDKDPTSIQITWSSGDNITYVESTTIMVHYRMSNGTPIQTGILTATIGSHVLPLVWNVSTEAYHGTYYGDMDPPGIGEFLVQINASSAIFASQSTSVPFSISEEPTVAIASWTTIVFDWTQSVILEIEYRDSYGRLIDGATLKSITIDGSPYTLIGNSGTYWMEFNNTFNLGHHNVVVNISKFGYEYAVNSTISFDIVEASTSIALNWTFTTIDYLGQISLSANYTYSGTGSTIPVGLVEANITIDGTTTLILIPIGDLLTRTLDGDYLDLGSHSVVVRAQAYGYNYAELSETLNVTEVSTISSTISWIPSNVTIEYTDSLELVVDYTYSEGDVPATALVNVTIDEHFYNLTYSTGAWRVLIPGSDLDIGIYDAYISAWLYGYELRTNVTSEINVTLAANSFRVTWEPGNLTPTYSDQVNLTVIYIEDFLPIENATVKLYINGSTYDLTYNDADNMWHFNISAAVIDLGVWNVTVTANKTGYADGFFTDILTVVQTPTTLSIFESGDTVYFDETTAIDVYYQLVNLSSVPGAGISFTLNSVEQILTWNWDHWNSIVNGTDLGVGIHTFTIIVSSYGFEPQSDTLVITVLQIPTSINTDADFAMFARDSISFKFTFMDARTSTPIYATEFDYVWSYFYTVNMLSNYTYVVTIGGSDFHIGNYTFQCTIGRLGFNNSTGVIDIEVVPISTELIYDSIFSQYENETITIELQFFDSVLTTSIDWASVIVELESVGYAATYVSGISTYSVSFRIPMSIAPGTYDLYLSADAEDCQAINIVTELEVLAKSEYLISITIADQVQAGSSENVSIKVTEGSQPISGIFITIKIVFSLSEGGPQVVIESGTSDTSGIIFVTFDIPEITVELEITASFIGSISEWPVETIVVVSDVTPASTGTSTGAPIVADPLIISIVAGGVFLPILALAYRRKRRGGGRVSSPVSVAPSSPVSSVPEAASGMLQNVMDEIKNSEDGITRAELSRRLGPSASKIGSLVNDLLGADLGFYEVRDGARKLIKFKED